MSADLSVELNVVFALSKFVVSMALQRYFQLCLHPGRGMPRPMARVVLQETVWELAWPVEEEEEDLVQRVHIRSRSFALAIVDTQIVVEVPAALYLGEHCCQNLQIGS